MRGAAAVHQHSPTGSLTPLPLDTSASAWSAGGIEAISPKTKQNQNNHAVQKGGNATIEAYEVVGWWGKEKTTSDSSDLTAPSRLHYNCVSAERGEVESKAQVTVCNRCEQR